jgi:hypothetical protein
MATPNIDKILDKLQARLDLLKANKNNLQYFEDHGDGGFWRDLTEEKAAKFANDDWDLVDLQVGEMYFLVKTDIGIRLLNKNEYETYMGETHILYQGSYQACKDFIKVD